MGICQDLEEAEESGPRGSWDMALPTPGNGSSRLETSGEKQAPVVELQLLERNCVLSQVTVEDHMTFTQQPSLTRAVYPQSNSLQGLSSHQAQLFLA